MPNIPNRPPDDANDPRFIIVEAAPAMLWLGDQQGNCVYMNRELREFWGLRPDLGDFSWDKTLHPADAEHLFAVHMAAMKGQTAFEVEARYRRADGQWRMLHTTARPRFSSDGVFLGMVGQNSDVTDQRTAEANLDRTADQLSLALDAAEGVGTWQWSKPDNRIQGDRRFAETFGMAADVVAAGIPFRAVLGAIYPPDRNAFASHVSSAMANGGVYRSEFRVETPGALRWLLVMGRCTLTEDGQPAEFAGVILDINEQKNRERQLDLLARELEHRIKNIFSVVGGMARLSAREAPTAVEAFESFQSRITAMAAAYAQVVPTGDQTAKAGTLLALLDRLFAPFNGPDGAHVDVQGPDFPLSTKAASNLALIFHELATNAAKYGALTSCGSVLLNIERLAAGQVGFTWQEKVADREVVEPSSLGFGSQVLQLASANFRASPITTWRPEGLLWQMTVAEDHLTRL